MSPLTTDKMRESYHVIPFVDGDFDSQPSTPVDTDFYFPPAYSPLEEDLQVASVLRKQHPFWISSFSHIEINVSRWPYLQIYGKC